MRGPVLSLLLLQISHYRTIHSICLLYTCRFCSALIIVVIRHYTFKIHTTGCFVDLRQLLTLSILANFQNGHQQKTSNTDDERVCKFQLQRPSQKNFTLFRSFREYFRHVSKLHNSQQRQPHTKHTNRPSTRTHARFYYGRSRPGLRPGRPIMN